MNTTGEGLLAPAARAPGCRFPPKPAEGAISMGFSCRLSVLPESGACVPNAALRSRSVSRPVLRDLPKGPLVSSVGRRPGPTGCPWKGPASERSGSVRFRGGVMTTPCRARKVSKFWELGVLVKSNAGIALVGEPRIGGRGFRCRKSGSLGEPRKGRQDCSPWEGCGGLACGWPNATPSGSVGGLGSLGRTTCRSERLGALCRRQPSPAVWGECSGAEEPGRGDLPPRISAACGEGAPLQPGRSGMVPTWGDGV